MYKLGKPFIEGGQSKTVQRLIDKTWIPFDPANTDYQAFLRWCEEGNQPLPAEENNG